MGRVAGDLIAMTQGAVQINSGGSAALAGAGAGGVGAIPGLLVGGHGLTVVYTAEKDLVISGARYLSMSGGLNSPKASENGTSNGSSKSVGELRGAEFEDYLADTLEGGNGGFKMGGRDFDGSYKDGKVWFEAKSGNFWKDVTSTEKGLAKFKSDMGDRLRIAKQNNKVYELFSNSKIPENVKTYLKNKGIKYTEVK